MLDPSQLALVNRVLLCNFDRIDAIHHVRTRRSGVIKYIEIGVGFSADRRIGEIDAINQSLKKELEGANSGRQGHPGHFGHTGLKMGLCSARCGAADAHHLRPDQVSFNERGDYVVDGYREPLPAKIALPSLDGEYWIFYRDKLDGSRSAVFCFFVPMKFYEAITLRCSAIGVATPPDPHEGRRR